MKRLVSICLLGALLVLNQGVLAYELDTHEKLSEAATSGSVLKTDSSILRGLGLQFSIEDDRQQFPGSDGKPKNILNLIKDGSRFEDDATRSLNHFYDPLRNRGLFGVNIASPDWALEDAQDADSQEFSYKDARDYLYQALTSSTEAARKQFFGKTFQTLGQVIHHLQDMAQPQHVRNDAHCDAIFPCLIPGGLFGLYSPSLYEEYTNYHRGKLLYTGYDPVTFPTARGFWTGNGAGIADYTNHNFLSAGTNFDTRHYPNPFFSPATEREENANNLMANAGVPIPPECLPPNDPCVMTFYGNLVQDRYRPAESRDNPRASTWSLFDQDLKVHNKTITRTDPDTGQTYTSNQAFSLNRFNFDEAHTFLIPRAVAYSAGLIDYFFRGRLEGEDVEFSDNGVSLRVKGLRLTGEDSRSVSVDTGQICISPTKSETVNKDVVFYGSELAADTVTYPPFLGGCRTRGYQDSQPIVSSLNSWLPFYDTPRPPVLSTYLDKGSLAVDTTGNLFVSGTTVNSSKAFRYFSGGDLSIIVPSLPANSIFHPIGLVR